MIESLEGANRLEIALCEKPLKYLLGNAFVVGGGAVSELMNLGVFRFFGFV
jgi:hypothetical protein